MTNSITLPMLSGLLLAGAAQAQQAVFAPIATYPVASTTRNLTVADVNGDSKADVVTANQASNTVGVLLGNGNGTFRAVATYSMGANSNPYDVAVADVNADGKPDVLTANNGTNSAGVLLGNGDGTFQAAASYATGAANGAPMGIAVADITGDGKPDLITANSLGYSVSVLMGTGAGTFQAPVSYTFGPATVPLDVTVADFNADGKPDLVVASVGSNTVALLMGQGGSSFQPGPYAVGVGASFTPYGVATGDVNGDGRPDVVTANMGNSSVSVLLNQGASLRAAASFQDSGSPVNIAVADVNLDGQADLLTANPGDPGLAVLLGNGNGTFQPLTRYLSSGNNAPQGLVVADVNGDGRPDVLTANVAGTVGVLLNTTLLAARPSLPGATATLHPNPATVAATLSLAGLPAAVAQVQATLLNATGRAVAHHTLVASQGIARVEMPTAGLAAGFYVLRLAALDVQGAPAGSLPTQHLSVQ